jgi:hypothetical protein
MSAKKNYEILITGFATVLVVAAESEEKAMEYAINDCRFGNFQMDEASVKRIVPLGELEAARRNADLVSEDVD